MKGILKMYKLIAIDLDGTMLNSYSEIGIHTKDVLNKAIQNGIEIVIASGRTVDSIKSITDEILDKKYIIAGNGSIIYDLKQNSILYEKYISKIKALNIINICEENNITYSIYTNKAIVANSLKHNVLYYYKENLKKKPDKKTNIVLVSDVVNYVKSMPKDEKVIKILISDNSKSVFSAILRKMQEIENINVLDVSHMSRKIINNGSQEISLEYFYTEITEENVDKWYALELLIKKLNIDKKDVIAIGDNVNDIKMLENCGVGIAMKNAVPCVCEIADCITDYDNNNDGVGYAIEKFLM